MTPKFLSHVLPSMKKFLKCARLPKNSGVGWTVKDHSHMSGQQTRIGLADFQLLLLLLGAADI